MKKSGLASNMAVPYFDPTPSQRASNEGRCVQGDHKSFEPLSNLFIATTFSMRGHDNVTKGCKKLGYLEIEFHFLSLILYLLSRS